MAVLIITNDDKCSFYERGWAYGKFPKTRENMAVHY